MLQRLREQVLEANLELVRQGLVLHTFGNASGICRYRARYCFRYLRKHGKNAYHGQSKDRNKAIAQDRK